MKIVNISDTHNQLKDILNDIPNGDILIHSGDATGKGTIEEIIRFNDDLGKLPHIHKIFVPGNHDWLFQTDPHKAKKLMTNAIVLIDESIVVEGIKLYGSPWQPEFGTWAFNLPKGLALANKWQLIPSDTDILVTHSPPEGILDYVESVRFGVMHSKVCGCDELYKRVENVQPKLHVFGHIHYSHGKQLFKWEDTGQYTTFVNASICTESYHAKNPAIVIDWNNLK